MALRFTADAISSGLLTSRTFWGAVITYKLVSTALTEQLGFFY